MPDHVLDSSSTYGTIQARLFKYDMISNTLPCKSSKTFHRTTRNSPPANIEPTFSLAAYTSSPCSSVSRETPSPVTAVEDYQLKSQSSLGKKYDKWTSEQQCYLVQLWADKEDNLKSKDAQVAWRDNSEMVNFKNVEKCLQK
ncbi:hypothetical protein OS493_012920 [Desmophyllum pertusum]|uniref:Uncharacterized protein n=1 Tax=Desmophyllum pertusum TaxID=174260 RepID=A0A9W9Z4S4_9CNID|nr:hypothetical protein OS493_012920 [Desmophyllum pertusum]